MKQQNDSTQQAKEASWHCSGKNMDEYCNSIGEFSSYMIRSHLAAVGAILSVFDQEKLKSIDFDDFIHLWREKIGPRFYYNTTLSIARQVEIFDLLGISYPIYIEKKQQIIKENRCKPIDLEKPAWFAIDTTDTLKGNRLQIGFANSGCEYWRQAKNHVGCVNCGFFINIHPPAVEPNENQASNKICNSNIIKQLDYVFEQVNGKHRTFDAVDFVGDGSFLNDNEISFTTQKEIFTKLAQMSFIKRVLVESRPEYIVRENLDVLLGCLRDDQKLEIAIGLESVDNFISTFCINKGFLLKMDGHIKEELKRKDIYDIITLIKPLKARVSLQLYTLVKPALLNEIETLADAVNTGRFINSLAKQESIDIKVKYEPTVIPRGTLLEVLNETYINRAGDIVNPLICEDKIDFFDFKAIKREGWKPLHTPPSYWTIVEMIAQLAMDGTHKIIRIGGREDMHISRAIPAVYDGNIFDMGMLSKIDFRLYYAVQRFNTHKDMNLFIYDIQHCLQHESFNRWKDEMVNLRFPQIAKYAKELSSAPGFENKEEMFLNELEDVIEKELEYSKATQAFLDGILENNVLPKFACVRVSAYVYDILHSRFPFISKDHVELFSLEYIKNEYPTIKKPEMFRLSFKIFNLQTQKTYDIWTFIPRQHIAYKIWNRTKRTEIEKKFIVEYFPTHLPMSNPTNIIQGYISVTKENEVRVRRKTKDRVPVYVETWKSKGDKTREEIEVEIDEKAFNELIIASEGKVIEKERYKIPFCFIDNHTAITFDINKYPGEKVFQVELDVFKGHLYGLMLAEVEFDSEAESKLLNIQNIPPWFGKEVTFDKRFKNQNLAKDKFDAILIPASKKYENHCLVFSDNGDFILAAQAAIKEKGLTLIPFDRGWDTPGEINSALVERLRGVNLVLIDNCSLDINILTKIAVRETVSIKTLFTSLNQLHTLPVLINDMLQKSINPPVISTFTDISLSKIIENQQIIDNEILAQIEKTSNEIWVITSTMEFDVGDLQDVVTYNLKKGKTYKYFVPHHNSQVYYSMLFKKNFLHFKNQFKGYMEEGKIAVHALPPDFQYCFKEILIYFSYESEPYAFTYIENRNSNDLELVKINNQLTQKIINIIDTTAIVLPQGLKNIQEEKL